MAALALALMGVALVIPQGSVLAAPADEAEMLDLINGARAREGLPALVPSPELQGAAEAQTDRQIAAGELFHTPDLASVATDWQALGENVGFGPNMVRLHDAFMASSGHRANVLGNYNQVAISAKQDEIGRFYITVIFMLKPLSAVSTTGPAAIIDLRPGAIDDIANTTFEADVEWLAERRIAFACAAAETWFCPSAAISRAEMATMMARGLDLPASPRDYFSDDEGSPHEADINAMAHAGITVGCDSSGTRYCPGDTLTRGQMASFFVRALNLAPAPVDYFSDDNRTTHESNINSLAHAQVTMGCNPPINDRFCGRSELTRGQIAAFLRRALQ